MKTILSKNLKSNRHMEKIIGSVERPIYLKDKEIEIKVIGGVARGNTHSRLATRRCSGC